MKGRGSRLGSRWSGSRGGLPRGVCLGSEGEYRLEDGKGYREECG